MRTVSGRADHVVVVGAGLSGLAASLHLCGRGRAVTVLERDEVPGGRAGRRDVDGYRLDTGPTVLTMPGIVGDTFEAVGASARPLGCRWSGWTPPIGRASPTAPPWTYAPGART